MKNSRLFFAGFCVLLGVVIGAAQNTRHPNLAAAQTLCRQAWEKITAAQKANEWDMEGHAQKAKDLVDQAAHEIKAAEETANRNKK
jgi:hypothetical protein